MIGCGSVTEVKSGPAFNKVPNSKLNAVMRRDANKVKDYASRHLVPLYFTDVDELIHHPEVDAIYIATPPKFHMEYAKKAMKAGKPVYVEKPMALSVLECEQMRQISNETGIKLVVAHYRRALPLFLHVKAMLKSNAIGIVQKVNIRMYKKPSPNCGSIENWRVYPELAGGGLFYDLAPHQLDLVFFYFGNVTTYNGSAENLAGLYPAEDSVKGSMQLHHGIEFLGIWNFSGLENGDDDVFEIIGTEGKISFPVFGNDITVEKNGEQTLVHFDPPQHNQQNFIHQVVQYFLGIGVNPCSADDALQSMRVMESFVYGDPK